MMLGKSGRGRHPMRRTTSMSELAPPCVLEGVAEEEAAAEEIRDQEAPYTWANAGEGGRDWLAAYCARAAARARAGHRRNSADCAATETAAFLRACGLCSRRLGPGRDTFMYKGDTAFCSLECRQQHMTQEEWKEKCALTSMKDQVAPVGGGGGGGSETAETGGAVAAA